MKKTNIIILLWFIVSALLHAEVPPDIRKVARDYAIKLVLENKHTSYLGGEYYMYETPDQNTFGMWGNDIEYLPGFAIFVKIADFNQDGTNDLGVCSHDSLFSLGELWLGNPSGSYDQFMEGVVIPDQYISVNHKKALRLQNPVTGGVTIDYYVWLNPEPEYSIVNSLEMNVVKAGDASAEILENLKKVANSEAKVEEIKTETWVVWIFDLLDNESSEVKWVKHKPSGGRFGLQATIEELLPNYTKEELTLPKLRERVTEKYGKSNVTNNGNHPTSSVSLSADERGLSKSKEKWINQQAVAPKGKTAPSRLRWIIGGGLSIIALVLLFRILIPKPKV